MYQYVYLVYGFFSTQAARQRLILDIANKLVSHLYNAKQSIQGAYNNYLDALISASLYGKTRISFLKVAIIMDVATFNLILMFD